MIITMMFIGLTLTFSELAHASDDEYDDVPLHNGMPIYFQAPGDGV